LIQDAKRQAWGRIKLALPRFSISEAALLKGRKHERHGVKMLVQLSSMDEPLVSELASTENVSPKGVKVTTERSWNPGSFVLVKSSNGELWAKARAVYCQPNGLKGYAVGLDFFSMTPEWAIQSKQLVKTKK
jgi:hypothetical protein